MWIWKGLYASGEDCLDHLDERVLGSLRQSGKEEDTTQCTHMIHTHTHTHIHTHTTVEAGEAPAQSHRMSYGYMYTLCRHTRKTPHTHATGRQARPLHTHTEHPTLRHTLQHGRKTHTHMYTQIHNSLAPSHTSTCIHLHTHALTFTHINSFRFTQFTHTLIHTSTCIHSHTTVEAVEAPAHAVTQNVLGLTHTPQ